MGRVGVWPNLDKEQARGLTRQLCRWLVERGFTPVVPDDAAQALGLDDWAARRGDPVWEGVLFVVVLGGDGTLLHAARSLSETGRPLLGVNLGHVGFLTEVEVADLFPTLAAFLEGGYVLDERLALRARVIRQGVCIATLGALNDVVVTKGPFARLVQLETFVDDAYVTTYPADGLILSTPTGSTAYSLSAGGPVVSPELGVLLLTPICPHSFFDRSIVIGQNSRVRVRIRAEHRETLLTVDGQEGFPLEDGDEVQVERDERRIALMRRPEWNFYHVLRGWQRGRDR
jgi:NAD+ kinase